MFRFRIVEVARQQIFGRRAVGELLRSGLEVTEVFLLTGGRGAVFGELLRVADARGVRVVLTDRAELDRMAPGAAHQGVVAYYKAPPPLEVEELLDRLSGDDPRPVLLLDGVEDPRNLGAVIRSAEVLGAGGVIIRRRRAAGLTPAAVKASAGGALLLPLAVTSNLDRAIRLMKSRDYWIYGLDPGGEISLWELDLEGLIGFVVGGEGGGLSRLTRTRCDQLVRIPQAGRVASLNVAVSTALAMGEWLRQTMRKGGQGVD